MPPGTAYRIAACEDALISGAPFYHDNQYNEILKSLIIQRLRELLPFEEDCSPRTTSILLKRAVAAVREAEACLKKETFSALVPPFRDGSFTQSCFRHSE